MSDENKNSQRKFIYNLDEIREKYKNLREKTFVYYINLAVYILLTSLLFSLFQIPILGRYENESNLFVYVLFIIINSFLGGIYFRYQNGYFGLIFSLIIFILSSILTFVFTIYPQTILYKGNNLNLYLFYIKMGYHFRILFFNFITVFLIFLSVYYGAQLIRK
ncbi:MAG: hypothetical protein N3A58_03000 [Spirochaetes bacterium]|nr:hypothetical protein [Spirochaetota bacterium]